MSKTISSKLKYSMTFFVIIIINSVELTVLFQDISKIGNLFQVETFTVIYNDFT